MERKRSKIWEKQYNALCYSIRVYLTGKRVSAFPLRLKYLKSAMELTGDILEKMDNDDLFCLTMKSETANITLVEFQQERESLERACSLMQIASEKNNQRYALFNAYLAIDRQNSEIKKLKNNAESAKRILGSL